MGGDEKRRGRRGEKNKLNRDPGALGGEHGVSGCSPPPRVSPPCRPPPRVASSPVTPAARGLTERGLLSGRAALAA